jgi:hypothetical protein
MPDEKNPYSLRAIFQQMELALITSLKRNFYRHENEELKEGFQWEQWQLAKLRNLLKYRKSNKDIAESYNKPIEKAIEVVLQESFSAGEVNVEKVIKNVKEFTGEIKLPQSTNGSGGIKRPELPKLGPEENFFGVNGKKLKALQDSVKNDLKKAQQSVLRKMDDVYRQTIYKTHVNLQAGAVSLNKAIDMATKDFLDKGINSIEYKDGKKVNISSYAEMALRTASQRATFLGEGKKRDEWGMHLIVVSAHATTCERCAPWQGKILIDDVFSKGTKADGDYPLLSDVMKAGLLHPNCRHTLITYFPGVTELPKIPDEGTARRYYEAEQQQRYIERQIRKWKRRQTGSVDAENATGSVDKVKEWQDKLKQHLKDNRQLRRDYRREKVR